MIFNVVAREGDLEEIIIMLYKKGFDIKNIIPILASTKHGNEDLPGYLINNKGSLINYSKLKKLWREIRIKSTAKNVRNTALFPYKYPNK